MFDNSPSGADDQPSKTSRRSVIRTLGLGAVATPMGIQLTAADKSGDGESTFDTSFDPDNSKKVAKFVSNTFEWSNRTRSRATTADASRLIEDQRRKVVADLSEQQLESVRAVLRDIDLVVGSPSPATSTADSGATEEVSPNSCNNYNDTVKAYIQVPYVGDTLHAFTFEVDVGWCVDGDEVINVTPSTTGNAQGYVLVNWDYQGVSDESLNYHPDNYYATSYQKGKYNRCIVANSGVSCVATDYGWIEAAVYNDRSGRTVEKGADG